MRDPTQPWGEHSIAAQKGSSQPVHSNLLDVRQSYQFCQYFIKQSVNAQLLHAVKHENLYQAKYKSRGEMKPVLSAPQTTLEPFLPCIGN